MAKKKKGKRRMSKELANAQNLELGVTQAAHRIANAVDIGLDNWDRSRKKEKNLDGVFSSAWTNSVSSAGRAARELTWVPADFYKAIGPKLDPRRILVRALLPFWR